MKLSAVVFYPIAAILFFLDAIFYFGYDAGVEFVIKYPLSLLGVSLVGFIYLIFVNKEKINNKYLPSVAATIGIVINLFLIVTWYVFKDFGF